MDLHHNDPVSHTVIFFDDLTKGIINLVKCRGDRYIILNVSQKRRR